MTPLELRAGLEQLLTRAETAERALAVAQRDLEEANLQWHRYATEAAVLTVRLENCQQMLRTALESNLNRESER